MDLKDLRICFADLFKSLFIYVAELTESSLLCSFQPCKLSLCVIDFDTFDLYILTFEN